MTMMASPMHPTPTPSTDLAEPQASGRLVATDGRTLPLRATSIETSACGGVARVVLKQQFVNPYDEPLTVSYQVPLPADGAVSGFAFQLGDKRIVGEVDTKKKARARYETALVEGRSAALLEQDRSSLFTQEVGNIPPGGEITAEIQIDQKLRWLAEGSWEWRFPTVVAPRYSGATGRVADVAKLHVDVADDELDVRTELTMAIEDVLKGRPESPSHGIVATEARGATHIVLRAGEARLDRDVVVRWPVAAATANAQLAVVRPASTHAHAADAFGLLTIVPPSSADAIDEVPRDLILLIDTSGSMHGEPLAQARRVCLALIDSLDEDDQLEMIEFSWRPTHWKRKSVAATSRNKKSARQWLADLEANGGTEMREGILSALRPLRDDAQRQIVIISDGLIGFENEIVNEIANRLPAGSRVHTVGVGSGVNRSLTAPAARAGRGVEAIIGIGEDAERAAERLVANTALPAVVDLEVTGDVLRGHAPQRLPDLMGGAPALLALRLAPEGGEIVVRGNTAKGSWQQRVVVPAANRAGEGHASIAPLFARERVEDLELERAAGEGTKSIEEEITELGLSFQISTRLTSWVAVSKDPSVDPTAPSRQERMPHELPYGMSVQKLGLRAMAPPMMGAIGPAQMPMMPRMSAPAGPPGPPPARAAAPPPPPGFGPPPPPAGFGAPSPASGGPRAPEQDEERLLGAESERATDDMDEEAPADALAELPAPAPAKPRPVKRKRSLRQRVTDGVRDMLGRGELRGTILVSEDDRLVVSITAAGALRWEPLSVLLELEDGSEIEVQLIAELTTRPTDATQGQVLRLAMRWTGGELAATPQRIRVSSPNGELSIVI
jgi:Ca-activated chloride channel family protein